MDCNGSPRAYGRGARRLPPATGAPGQPDGSASSLAACRARPTPRRSTSFFPLKRVMAYDVRPKAVSSFAEEMSRRFGLEVLPVDDPRQAVSGCDMVVTAGPILKVPHATIQADWWDEGAFASLVDFDSFWHPAAMKQAAKFCTDDIPQLMHYKHIGYFQDIPPIYADLGELVAGPSLGARTPPSGPLPATWVWPWTIWRLRPPSTGGRSRWASAPGCRSEALRMRVTGRFSLARIASRPLDLRRILMGCTRRCTNPLLKLSGRRRWLN